MGFVFALDPRSQPLTVSFLYTLDPRTQPLRDEAVVPPVPPVVVVPVATHGGKPAPFAKVCTWEEYKQNPWRCQYAEITGRPADIEQEIRELPPAARDHIAAVMGLEMGDKDVITRMAAAMALRMLE